MKLQSKPLCALAFALLGSLATASSVHAVTLEQVKERGVIRVAVANEIPYGYMDMSGKAQGAGPEVAQAILERLGVKEIDPHQELAVALLESARLQAQTPEP